MNILTFGGATQDVFIQPKDVPTLHWHTKNEAHAFLLLQEGTKMEITDLYYSTGGGATNAAVAFSRLGFSVFPVFKIGNDYAGHAVLQDLRNEQISTATCLVSTSASTAISYILPGSSGDRTILTFRGKNTDVTHNEFPFDQLSNCHCVYITSLRGTTAQVLLPVARQAQRANILVAHNPGVNEVSNNITELALALPYIDILILNLEEAQHFMHTFFGPAQPICIKNSCPAFAQFFTTNCMTDFFNLPSFFQEVSARGPRTVVVTNGADGVYVYHQKTIYFHPSMPVHIASTLGAGDAFGSCFVASLLQNIPIEQAILRSMINSASVISKLGAKEGLLHSHELQERMEQFAVHHVQQFQVFKEYY